MSAKRTITEAERQTARYTMLTTGAAAEVLDAREVGGKERINADTVRGWIEMWLEGNHEEGLQGGDFRRKRGRRPQYFTTPEYIEDFIRRRFGVSDAA